MIENKKILESAPDFDIRQLSNITFGKLEGERDPLLEDCFFPTRKVQKYLIEPYNYVLSPKGAGKSALFRALSDGFINEHFFKSDSYSIIPINEAFGFDDDYLNIQKFSENSRMKLTVSWLSLYLLKLLVIFELTIQIK